MHDRQQHPAVGNNIIGCNHIMQWHWQLLLPEIYFHQSCDGTCWLCYVWVNAYSYMPLYWKPNHAST